MNSTSLRGRYAPLSQCKDEFESCHRIKKESMDETLKRECSNSQRACEDTCANRRDKCFRCEGAKPVPEACYSSCSVDSCYNECLSKNGFHTEGFFRCTLHCDANEKTCQTALLSIGVNCFPCESECADLISCPAACASKYSSCSKPRINHCEEEFKACAGLLY